jgi:hypothetical protein
MGILGDSIARSTRRTGDAPARLEPASSLAAPRSESPYAPPGSPTAQADRNGASELRRRRDALADQVTELHWDLGGLAYEMAIRDHFRLDVLVRRAAVLQERDAELAEVERLLRLEDSASAGSCPHCAAPHSRGAVFCWQCGATLLERSRSWPSAGGDTSGEQGSSTAVMDALLAPEPTRSFGAPSSSDAFGAPSAADD